MKIIDIYNLPRQSSYDIQQILTLKDWGRSLFPAQNNLGVDWEMLKKNVPGLQAFYVETELNKFFTISLNNQKFILVNYDKVIQCYTPYCTDTNLYEAMMKLLIAHSDLSYCYFSTQEDLNIILPNDDGYYTECDD
jgi:hypothetical protein